MRMIAGILTTTLLLGGVALAVDDPDERLSGTSTVIKTGKTAKVVGKPTSATPLPSSSNAPTLPAGGSLQIFDTGKTGNDDTYTLPASGWSRLPAKDTKPLKGYKYKGSGSASDPCKSVIVKETVVKATCKGSGVQLTTPFTANVGVILTLGPDSKRYCASFGGTGKNDEKLVNRKGAPPPSSCPTPFLPTTTSTSSTSSTSHTTVIVPSTTTTSLAGGTTTTTVPETTTTTLIGETTTTTLIGETTTTTLLGETTTTTIIGETTTTTLLGETTTTTIIGGTTTTTIAGCCNGDGFVSVLTKQEAGDCGDIIDAAGVLVKNIDCSGLFTGGGGNSVPLPFTVPDKGQAVSAITSCSGQTASLGGTTSTETGSNRNCTGSGCLFGAPLAVPNPGSTPTSVCVLNAASTGVTGTLVCDTGETTVNLPLTSVLFLTGDTATDPSSTITGIQPCPLCSGGDPGTCIGGPNNGQPCTPGTSALNAAYPTSHDCPPDPMFNIGSLPIAFKLSSGTITWTGTTATNDTGSTTSTQGRVFSGFCRDTIGTGAFQQPFQQCWENGMAVGSACSGSFQSCEQRTNGAFGPSGGNNKTITAIGSGTSLLGGPADGHLVSIFSIPPTFDATVDSAGDLPGPGAVALPATAQLCANAMCQ